MNLDRRNNVIWLGIVAFALSFGALALWGTFLAREGLEGIFPWRLAKLHWILAISGVWLAFIGVFLLVCYLARRWDIVLVDLSSLLVDVRPCLALVIMLLFVVSNIVAYGWLATERHNRFNSTGYDLAIKEQVIWNTAHGRFFASSLEVENAFADHFQPIMLMLVPLYVLAPSPELLLWVQAVCLAVGAIPVYWLARRRLEHVGLALALAAAYLLYPAIGFINRFDFHPEIMAVPAFLFAFDALDRGSEGRASLWLLIPLLSKENMGLSVAALGLYAALFMRRVRFGLAWIVVGLLTSVGATFWLIPTLRQAPSNKLLRYSWLGEGPVQMMRTLITRPGYVLRSVIEPNRVLYVLQILAPVGFLPLAGLPELLMVAPGLALNLLSEHYYQSTIYCHYTVPVVPFVFIAAIVGLQRLKRVEPRWPWYVVGLGVVPLAMATLVLDNPFTENNEPFAPLARLPNAHAVRRALTLVPTEASVVTTNAYAPHLAQREDLRVLGIPALRDPPTDPDIVFINLYDQRYTLCEQYRKYFARLNVDQYGVIFRDSGVIVVQRDGGSRDSFRDFLYNWNDCVG